jgi:hypothetical protein
MKYLIIALTLILSACADQPTRNLYNHQAVTGWQDENGKIHLVGVASAEPTKPLVVTGEPMNIKPLGWSPAGIDQIPRYNLQRKPGE